MTLYNILAWVIFGLIAGAIAKAVMPGRDPGGYIVTIVLGIIGAIVGGFVGNTLFGTARSAADTTGAGFSIAGLLLAVVGAILVLAIYRLAMGRSVSS